MDWKGYEVKPDDGMFDAIKGRLRVRRYWRLGIAAATAVAAVAVVVAVMIPREPVEEPLQVAEVSGQQAAESGEWKVESEEWKEESGQQAVAQKPQVIDQEEEAVAVLPQTQVELVTVKEPVAEPTLDTALFEQIAMLQNQAPKARSSAKEVELPSGDEVQEESQDNMPAKVGSASSTTEGVDGILWAPNIITPNGDVAQNRTFRVVASSDVNEFHIHIYNRGGRLVFRSNNIEEVWNATHNGVNVPQGAYVWVATFRDAEGTSHREAGTVTVVW